MIFLFSSSFYDLFRQNVLNACCFPDGQVMRVRYGREYLAPALQKGDAWKKLPGEDGVFVFAEGALENRTAEPKRDYRFLPIRYCKIAAVEMTAGIVFVDIKLGKFLDYGPDEVQLSRWDEEIKAHTERPHPKGLREAEGAYVYRASALADSATEPDYETAWRRVVDRLNQSELRDCVTYLVRGFFRRNPWPISRWWPDRRVKPKLTGPDGVYTFRTGETILVRVLLYGQANAKQSGKSLKVEFDSKVFTSASVASIPVHSRYNEERVLLPCIRGTDTVLSSLSFVPTSEDKTIWAAQPVFVVSVRPSGRYLLGVSALFALAFFTANMGSLTEYRIFWDGSLLTDPLSTLNKLTKPIGALLFLAGTWFYLRKFPLK